MFVVELLVGGRTRVELFVSSSPTGASKWSTERRPELPATARSSTRPPAPAAQPAPTTGTGTEWSAEAVVAGSCYRRPQQPAGTDTTAAAAVGSGRNFKQAGSGGDRTADTAVDTGG